MSSAPQHVMVSAFEDLRDYASSGAGPAVPGLYIAADESRPRSDKVRCHEMFPRVLYAKTVGVRHFCQLEVPEQVSSMADRLLTVSLRDGRCSSR